MEYLLLDTNEVLTRDNIKKRFANISLPEVWGNNVYKTLNITPILEGTKPTATKYQRVVKDGVVPSGGGMAWNYRVEEIYSEYVDGDGNTVTIEDQQAAHDQRDTTKIENEVRDQRDALLRETDWWASSDLTMTAEQTAYRQALRDITTHDNFPLLNDEDWPVKP